MFASHRLRFLVDAMVPKNVSGFLRSEGHEVFDVRDEVLPGTKDRAIVALANELSATVITWNRKHYRPLIHRDDDVSRVEFPNAGLLSMVCPPHDAVNYLKTWMPYIEFAHDRRQMEEDRRFIAELSVNGLQIR